MYNSHAIKKSIHHAPWRVCGQSIVCVMHSLQLTNAFIHIHLQTTKHRPEIFVLTMHERRLSCTKILVPTHPTTSFFVEFVKNHPLDGKLLSNCMQILSTASDLVTLTEWLEGTVECVKTTNNIASVDTGNAIIPVFEYRTCVKLY